MKDWELIEKFKEKFQMKEKCRIIYTDDSKQEENISTGVGIVIEEEEEAYKISIDKRCSVYGRTPSNRKGTGIRRRKGVGGRFTNIN